MNLKIRNFLILGCFCMFGIQSGLAMIREMQELMNECAHGGGFCINTMPPQPVRRRNRNRGMRRRMGTRTRKGKRNKPSPQAMGAQHNVLPGGKKAAPPAPAAGGAPAYAPPAPAQTTPGYSDPFSSFFNNFFGSGTGGNNAGGSNAAGNSFDPFYSMMLFTRKKRQANAPPPMFEPGEEPRRMRGQSMYNFLGQHCRKTDFSIGCRNTGGICCMPHLK